jgi:hypothetical protein
MMQADANGISTLYGITACCFTTVWVLSVPMLNERFSGAFFHTVEPTCAAPSSGFVPVTGEFFSQIF